MSPTAPVNTAEQMAASSSGAAASAADDVRREGVARGAGHSSSGHHTTTVKNAGDAKLKHSGEVSGLPEAPLRTAAVLLDKLDHSCREQSFLNVVLQVCHDVRSTPPLTLAWVVLLIAALMGGNAMQVIFLNYWLRQYPPDGAPGNYTTFAVSGLMFSLFFLVALALYVLVCRPNLRFAAYLHGWLLLVGIASMDTLSGGLTIYSRDRCPVVLQAIFAAVTPLITAALAKVVLHDPRRYLSAWVGVAFLLATGGVLVTAVGGLPGGSRRGHLVYLAALPPSALASVWQARYMLERTCDDSLQLWLVKQGEGAERAAGVVDHRASVTTAELPATGDAVADGAHGQHHEEAAQPVPQVYYKRAQGEDTIVKLLMLAVVTTTQSALTLLLMPAGATSWWGGSASTTAAWDDLREEVGAWSRRHRITALFCGMYSLGRVLTYIAAAYLNQYDVTLCAMLSLMSAPLTAFFRAVSSQGSRSSDCTPWYLSVVAGVLLAAGTLTYCAWGMQAEAEKIEGALRLKQRYVKAEVVHEVVVKAPDAAPKEPGIALLAEEGQTPLNTQPRHRGVYKLYRKYLGHK